MTLFNCEVSLLIFHLNDLSIGYRKVLKSPTIIVVGSVYAFKTSSICLMKLSAPTLGAYNLTIVISF
jgi:hypothetical protein